ncbi:MAG: DUF1499 domain-containing protein [Pseudomonadota bacterium]
MAIVILIGVLAITGVGIFYIRTVPHDPLVWHVDPRAVPPSTTPNSFRVALPEITEQPIDMQAPIYEVSAEQLAQAFDAFVMSQPRVERVAGSLETGHLTYVQRTEALQFPDYITVQFFDITAQDGAAGTAGTSTLALYSRSRFGYGDMGVNEARVRDWLASIESFAQ